MTSAAKPISAPKMAVRTAIILLFFVIAFTGLLSGVYLGTLSTIEAAASEEKMKLIDEVLPRASYDNALLKDSFELPASPALGQDEASRAYRARLQGQPRAAVFEAVAPDGYAGKIRLLIAIDVNGTLLGVRVTQHKETPGLGDYIEPKKDKNKERPWITQFDGLQAAHSEAREWKVRKDGGRFDSVAGATVTPRAIIKAVRKAAQYVEANHATFFASE
jgi:electron transport complex protein RnfG